MVRLKNPENHNMGAGAENPNGNRALVVLFAIAFMLSVAALAAYDRLFAKIAAAPEDAIAFVESVSPVIKHRPANRLEFREIKSSELLGNGDYIYSGEGSRIILKFMKGPRILIGEKSVISLRQNEGTPELKVENGTFSGTFEESESIDVVTENDMVTLNGETESQFAVSYLPDNGLEVSSYDRELGVEFNGKSASLNNQTAKLSQKKGIEVKNAQGALEAEKPQLPKGLEIGDSSAAPLIGLKPPYPPARQVFFHSKGGSILVFPKAACSGPCEVRLFIDGAEAVTKRFNRDAAPVLNVKVAAGMQAQVRWEFSDGGQKTEGVFEIRMNSKDNFEKAFANQYPVEVMN